MKRSQLTLLKLGLGPPGRLFHFLLHVWEFFFFCKRLQLIAIKYINE